MKFFDSVRRSAAQLRDLRSLTGASLLLALSILLGIVILFAFIMYYIKIFRGKYGLKTPRQP